MPSLATSIAYKNQISREQQEALRIYTDKLASLHKKYCNNKAISSKSRKLTADNSPKHLMKNTTYKNKKETNANMLTFKPKTKYECTFKPKEQKSVAPLFNRSKNTTTQQKSKEQAFDLENISEWEYVNYDPDFENFTPFLESPEVFVNYVPDFEDFSEKASQKLDDYQDQGNEEYYPADFDNISEVEYANYTPDFEDFSEKASQKLDDYQDQGNEKDYSFRFDDTTIQQKFKEQANAPIANTNKPCWVFEPKVKNSTYEEQQEELRIYTDKLASLRKKYCNNKAISSKSRKLTADNNPKHLMKNTTYKNKKETNANMFTFNLNTQDEYTFKPKTNSIEDIKKAYVGFEPKVKTTTYKEQQASVERLYRGSKNTTTQQKFKEQANAPIANTKKAYVGFEPKVKTTTYKEQQASVERLHGGSKNTTTQQKSKEKAFDFDNISEVESVSYSSDFDDYQDQGNEKDYTPDFEDSCEEASQKLDDCQDQDSEKDYTPDFEDFCEEASPKHTNWILNKTQTL